MRRRLCQLSVSLKCGAQVRAAPRGVLEDRTDRLRTLQPTQILLMKEALTNQQVAMSDITLVSLSCFSHVLHVSPDQIPNGSTHFIHFFHSLVSR